MYERNRKTGAPNLDENGRPKPKTAHSLNPVPVYLYDPDGNTGLALVDRENAGISSLAATCINLLGYQAPEGYDPSLITVKTLSASRT
jgi:2,3-bisphosphoglycerate-independent phosphoglycerate mutase